MRLAKGMEYHVSEWDPIRVQFTAMFQDLGEIKSSSESLSYNSLQPHVATGVMLTKEGVLIASMPLHHIDSRFERVLFDEALQSVRFVGPAFDYTYTVPSELLQLREA